MKPNPSLVARADFPLGLSAREFFLLTTVNTTYITLNCKSNPMKGTNPMKQIYDTSDLSQGLKAELAAMLQSLAGRYGAAAVSLGIHIENLAAVVAMVGDETLADRQQAQKHARAVYGDVIRDLCLALRADADAAFAVARSLRDYTKHAETEILGERPAPATVASEAARIIAAAQAN